ncbi:MAG: transglycosylase SLT domain-containing protein [Phototrophicales bacterium]
MTYVVVTGDPQSASIVSSPIPVGPTPIPPTATPEIPPEIALQIADRALLDGYYEHAVYGYEIILDMGERAPQTIQAAAAYGMVQAALREGFFDKAVEASTILIARFPTDYRAAQAYFLRGEAYLGLSRWQDAIDDFEQYLTLRPGVIDSYAYERIGDAYVNLGQMDNAMQSYQLATQSDRSAVPQAALHEEVARRYRSMGLYDLAVAEYDAILAFAQNVPYRASIDYLAAQTWIEAGDLNRALLRLEHVFNTYEDRPEAYDAMIFLLQNGRTLDPYQMGRVSFFAGDYVRAIEAFNTYTSITPLTEVNPQVYLLLGQAYRAIGNNDAALISFQTVIDQHSGTPLFGDALLEQGRTRFLSGDIPGAIERYLQIADTYAYLEATAAEALWRAGYLYATNDAPADALQVFIRLADTYPNATQTRSGLQFAASAAVTLGDIVTAEQIYNRLATITSGEEQADVYLQLAQLAFARGDSVAANAALNAAISAAPDTYYSARAEDIRAGRAPFTPPVTYVFEFDDLAEVTEAENWLRTQFGVVQDGVLWPLSFELEQDPRIVRGRELWAVGAYSEATTEFMDVIDDYKDNALASYQLAIYMRIIGAYRPSIFAAANLIILSGQRTIDVPPYIARMRYPAYYGDEVRRVAAQYGFDPLLLFSLIRHESLFDTNATAAAGEKGLTQVIPSTAQYIAEQLNWADYQHRDLFRPYAGIEFGAFFLAENLNRFDGNVYAALAGYNAGPGRAIDWLNLSGGDPDRFMASITISSTRLYIQRIYSNYNIYRELYGSE